MPFHPKRHTLCNCPAMVGIGWVLIAGMTGLAWWWSQPLWLVALFLTLGLGGAIWQRREGCAVDAELAMLEAELQQLQRTQDSKDDLLAMVSHELRTPMNVVMGLHPRIREGLAHDPHALALLDQAHGAAEGLLQVFKSILDTSQRAADEHAADATHRERLRNQTNTHGAQPIKTQVGAGPATTQHAGCVMVVDDNPVNVLVVRLMLENMLPNARLLQAHSAQQAMEQLADQVPDVMLLDVRMPEVDGYALARWVRNHTNPRMARLPILALTGASRPEDARLRESCRMDAVLYKPIDEQQLRLLIQRWLPINPSKDQP